MQIPNDDLLMFIDRALESMVRIVEALGDERANRRPDLPGANSPYVILTHCVGVANYWIGTLLAGRQLAREREAEFRSRGTVGEIRQAVRDLQRRLREDITQVQGDQPLVCPPSPSYNPAPDLRQWSQGAALMHAYEELAQHHGQMELTRDLLMKTS